MIKKRVYPPKSSYRVKKLGALLSNETEKIIRGEKDWKDFLRVASKFISYPFHTQVLLYSQKPDTTAVASFQLWNKLGLSVAPGTHGVEVLTKLDTDYPSITQLHPIENVREAVRGRKKAFSWTFPLEATEQLVERICPVGTVGESPEERLWNWTISNVETENAEEVFNKCEEKGYSLGVNKELLQNSELTQTEWLMKFMQASAAYEVFARCGLDTSVCDQLNESLLQGNPFSLSALFDSNEEAFGFLGDEISLTAGSAFKVIRTEVKAYTEEQAKIRAGIIEKSVPLEREAAKVAAPMLEVSVSSNATDTKDNKEVVARYLFTMNMEDGYVNHIAILRGADGYHNHFLYDEDKGKGAAGTGAFATLEEAKQDVLAHYPDATEIAPEISKEAEELAVAKKLITDFCEQEYGDEKVDFSDLHQISLAYTTSDDEAHEIQVNCDLIAYRMDYLVDGVKVREDQYNSLSDLIAQELSGLDFDGLTSVALNTIPDQDKDIFFAAKDGNLYRLLDSWDEQYNKEEILSCQVGHSKTDGEDFYLAVVKGGQLGKREFEFDQQPTREQVISRYADDEAEWAINRNEAAAEPFRELENENKPQPDYDIKEITPLSDEYLDLKEAYPGYVIGVEVGPSYLFYGKDAKLTAELFGTKLITDHIPGIAETSVTGSSLSWQALANKLLERGKSNLFARPENGSYVIQKINDIADFLPVGIQIQDGNRKFTIDSVNYESGSVSLRDDTFLQQTRFPIFRNEKISVVRELVEEEQARVLNKQAELHENEQLVLHFGEPASSGSNMESAAEKEEERPEPQKIAPEEELDANPISASVDGKRQTFPNAEALDKALHESVASVPAENFRITDDNLGEGGPKEKFHRNMDAIRMLHTIEREGRQATHEEQEILSKYVGWGGLSEAFDSNKANWKSEYDELQTELTPEEYKSARGSVLNSHYTSPVLIRSIYAALSSFGFGRGNVLEPACGVGNFFGMLPESMENSRLFGVELDDVSGRIARQLYPNANISICGYENTKYPDNFFDVVVGNVPFGDYKVMDRAYDKYNFMIHDYFIAKGLDQLRPGGIMAVITSAGTMDKINASARQYFAGRANLLGAIRLPDNAFKANAGTEVMTDILFFQKADGNAEVNPDWLRSEKTISDKEPLAVGDTVRLEVIRGYNRETRQYDPSKRTVTAVLTEIEKSYYGKGEYTYRGIDVETNEKVSFYEKPELVQRGVPVYTYNMYFQHHPEMVLGELKNESGPFGEKLTCKAVDDGSSLEEKLSKAISNIKGVIPDISVEDAIEEEAAENQTLPADPAVKNFSYTVVDDKVYYRQNSLMILQKLSGDKEERMKALIGLSVSGYHLLKMELEDQADDMIHAQMAVLNEEYDDFVAKYGRIAAKENKLFENDASYGFVSAFENYDEKGKFIGKADIFSKRTVTPRVSVSEADNAEDALLLSLSEKGRVDLPYMASLLKDSRAEELPSQLKGIIYRDPEKAMPDPTSGYVTADEYLSGNIRKKISAAEKVAESDPSYTVNIEALKQVMPKPLEAQNIDVRLGATWIAPKYIQKFMEEKLNVPHYRMLQRGADEYVSFEPSTAEWYIANKSVGKSLPLCIATYGTERKNALEILENTLNLRDTKVYDRIIDEEGREKSVLNKTETALCNTKAELLKEEFENWIFSDPERRADLVKTYNERFNNVKTRSFDGSFLTFPGMNPEIHLREHQKNAVARALFGGNELLAHVVGAGKTYTMIASAMEAKRIGTAHKSLFVVPNHLTEQWGADFLKLYPTANVLVATKNDFTPARRKLFCSKIATGSYDAVIIGHSQFEKIPLSKQRQVFYMERQIDQITQALSEAKEKDGKSFTVKQLEKTQKKLKVKLDKLNDDSKKDDVVTFEQLGVDRLFVDESHYYKNLFLYTKMSNVAGVQQTEASKSSDMYMKCQYMDELTGGRGIVFATGTPISNSMTELYTNMRYLQAGVLREYGLDQFDAWAANFGNVVTAIELTPEGVGYRAKKRFSSFFNIPELMSLWHEAADVQTADMLKLPVPEAHIFNVKTQPTKLQRDMVAALADRAENVRNQNVDPSDDNMLKITNDGRKLALDQRMINPSMPDVPNSKVNSCVDISFGIWEKTKEKRSAQLIFCDLSTPKGDGSFNVYDDIKQKLINKGVPENEIAFIHDAKTEIQKDQLFKKVRNGDVRFLLGSTQKMGAGTNVQDHLIALHHLDVPWRPSDIEQREGRIIRQGNLNKDVSIYRYVTADTFDAYSWQLIENKQKFISQIMTSKSPVRTCSDIDESALSYAEVKALATGNPYIKEKMELDVSVAKLKMERSAYQSGLYRLQDESNIRLPKRIASLESAVKGMQADISLYDKMKPGDPDRFAMEIGGRTYTDRKNAGEALNKLARTSLSMYGQELPLGSYLGFKLLARMKQVFESSVYVLNIKGAISHEIELGSNDSSNIALITKALNSMPKRLEELKNDLASANTALSSAKAEIEKPFAKEEIYQTQMARLKELDSILNISENADSGLAVAASDGEEPAIVDHIVSDTDGNWKAFAEYDPKEVSLYKDESLDAPEITEALKIEETAQNDTDAADESEEEEAESTNVQSEVSEPKKTARTKGNEGRSEMREGSLQQSENSISTADNLEEASSNQHQYKVRFSTMGNGITVWDENAPVEEKPYDTRHQVMDYHSLAYISPDGTRITFFEDEKMLPKEITDEIKKKAELQTERYNPENLKYSFEEKKDVLVYDYSREKAAFVLQEGKFPPNYVIEKEILLRYRGQNMDAGDLYSSGVSKYPDAVSAMLSLSDMPVEGEKTRIQVIGLDAEGKEAPFTYRISEEQLEELARHQLVKEYGIQDTLKEPLVRIEWSETELFKDGQIIPLSEAETLFAGYDQAQNRIRDMIPEESNISFGYYKKTKFQILMDNEGKLEHYDGRYDLGDGDGGLLNHIYSIQKEYIQNDSFFAANAEVYGKEEAEKWRQEKAVFLKNTLPVLQAYLRYEVVYAGLENWRIYDKFYHNRDEHSFGKLVFEADGKEPISFRSLAEARKYLETTLRQPEFMAEKHHAIENRAIAATQKDYVKTALDNVEKCFAPLSNEDKDVLKHVRTEFALSLPSATKEKSCTYFRDGEVAGVNMSVAEAFNQMIVDRAIQNGKDFQVDITTDDGTSVTLGKADAKEFTVPVDEVNAELNLQGGTVSKDLWNAVRGIVPVVKVEDPYNCLNLPFEEYQKHELDNTWKAPAIRFAHYGITLSPYQKEKLEQLNRQVGFYTSAEDIKHIASEKPIKGCNRSFDKKDIELASELKNEIVDRYDGVQQERSEKQEIVSLWDRQDNGLEV